MKLIDILARIKTLATEPAASGYDFVTAMREIERLAKLAQEIAA